MMTMTEEWKMRMNNRKVFLSILKLYNEAIRGVNARFNGVEVYSKEWVDLEKNYCLCLGQLRGTKELAYALGIIDGKERYDYTLDLISKIEEEISQSD